MMFQWLSALDILSTDIALGDLAAKRLSQPLWKIFWKFILSIQVA
ncbi:MAG: hypothetical protein ABI393_08805 [Paralcaligenes sp.]